MKMFHRSVSTFLIVVLMAAMAFATTAYADEAAATYRVQTQDGDPLLIHDATDPTRILGQIPNGATVEVYKIENGAYHRAYIEYQGVSGLFVYSDYLVPVNKAATTQYTLAQKEKTYTQEGTMLYRVKLDTKKWVNVQNQRDIHGGTAKRIYRGDYVYVSEIKGKWATVILDNGHKRYVEARLLEPVTEWTEPLENPLGEYVVTVNKLNVRVKPDSCAKSRKKLNTGDVVWVVEDLGAWALITNSEGKEMGYVMTLFLEFVAPEPQEAPIESAPEIDDEEIHICQVFGGCDCGCEYSK